MDSNYNYLNEERIDGEEIFDGVVVHLIRDRVRLPNGNESVREVIRHLGAVCVIPIFENGDVLVERQFRYPHAKVLLEIPAGKLDSKSENPLDAAKRELFEETGYTAERYTMLGELYTTPAFVDEVIWMYLAETVERMPLDTLCDMVMNGEIPDAKTQVAVLKAKRLWDERKK